MELMETNDPKHLLLQKSAKHKQELENEVKLLSENTEKIIKNALIIGGTLAVTYFLIRRFSGSKSKPKKKTKKIKLIQESPVQAEAEPEEEIASEPGIVSQIGSALAAQATVFLLDIAKDKLAAFLKPHVDKQADTSK